MSRKQPFAYATDKSEFIFSIRPTFVGALQAARKRFQEPTILIDITARFEDGHSVPIPWEELVILDDEQKYPVAWSSDEAAAALQTRLFPPKSQCRKKA